MVPVVEVVDSRVRDWRVTLGDPVHAVAFTT
ncbi:hypothetical protein JOF53_008267 [Crossiella equi]|uniref:Uncharacterized protein n=1 Tax=Crossiella equi TaxID=130796 RepID=A0ABS5AUM0_9PSEU|nr:hypothetical protein [Crossiella equi]